MWPVARLTVLAFASSVLMGCGSGAPPITGGAPDAGDAAVDVAAPPADVAAPPVDAAAPPVDGGPLPVFADAEPGPAADGGDGPAPGITPGQARGKFCHELNRGGQPVELTLEFGEPTLARISARTGVCAPPVGMPCLPIPVGLVPLRLREGDRVLAVRQVVLMDGADYVFQPVITSAGQVAVGGGRVTTEPCSTLDFPRMDAGADGPSLADAGRD
jgi:hypothetical protein